MLTIIGCGNLNRSDDGVGVVLAQRLQHRLQRHPVPGVQVFDCGTAGVDVMFKARGSRALLILDASRTGSDPGAVYDVPGEELANLHEPTYSLHDFRWDHALAAGRKIFKSDFPEDVRVWLVEAESLELGFDLSPPVKKAADDLYAQALALIADYAAHRHEAAAPAQIELVEGSIRLSKAVYDRYFDGKEGVLLIVEEGRLCLMPIDHLDGGLLVKQRNLQGDRVIPGEEVLRNHGFGGFVGTVTVAWDSSMGGLCLNLTEIEPRETSE